MAGLSPFGIEVARVANRNDRHCIGCDDRGISRIFLDLLPTSVLRESQHINALRPWSNLAEAWVLSSQGSRFESGRAHQFKRAYLNGLLTRR